jgi:hypothetical protein
MTFGLLIADVARAGNHGAVLGVLVLIAAVGALVYGLVRLVVKSRAGRTRSDRGPEGARDPGA